MLFQFRLQLYIWYNSLVFPTNFLKLKLSPPFSKFKYHYTLFSEDFIEFFTNNIQRNILDSLNQ
jgi:hypothetical protein